MGPFGFNQWMPFPGGRPLAGTGEFTAAARRVAPATGIDLKHQEKETESIPQDALTLALDLGQRADFSALVGIQRRGGRRADVHELNYVRRWERGTSYVQIIDDVEILVSRIPEELRPPALVVDITGVGQGIYDIIRDRHRKGLIPVRLYGVLIVAGRTTTQEDNGVTRVPKIELASALQSMLGRNILRVSKQLKMWNVLHREMQMFSVKVTASGNESYESWRERDHDDCVLAAAMGCWHCLRQRNQPAIHFGGNLPI